jgi:DNA-binding transcriptional regulator YiaG
MVELDGAQIKAARTALHMTAQYLAGKVNVSVATVQRWESGKNMPSPMAQAALRRVLRDGLRQCQQISGGTG